MHELRDEAEPSLAALLGRLAAVDIVLVEGFKREAHPKLEIHRLSLGKPLLHAEDPSIRAIASDGPVAGATVPVLHLDDVAAIAAHVRAHAAAV